MERKKEMSDIWWLLLISFIFPLASSKTEFWGWSINYLNVTLNDIKLTHSLKSAFKNDSSHFGNFPQYFQCWHPSTKWREKLPLSLDITTNRKTDVYVTN